MLLFFGLIPLSLGAICRPGVAPVCGEDFGAYNQTFLPNLLGQWSQNEISYTASVFYPLRAVGCSEHLELFLCSVLSPACVDDNPEGVLPFLVPVPPCQSLCHKVLDECRPVIEEFGIELPSELLCDNFPRQYTHPCVPIQPKSEPLPSGTLRWIKTEPTSEIEDIESSISEFQCPEGQISANIKTPFAGIEHCAKPCEPLELGRTETAIFRLILAVFSVFSAMVSAFSILIFLRDRKRFIYPERPTLYFALCYLMISVCYLVGLISPGEYSCSQNESGDYLRLFEGLASGSCTALFSISYFFSCAALSWWLVIILIWGLSIMFEWNIETIEKNGNYIHIFAWSPPAILTLLATQNETIEGEPMLGVCVLDASPVSLYYFQLLPTLLAMLVGTSIFLMGAYKLLQMRNAMQAASTKRLERFLIRIVVFSLVFILSRLVDLLLRMYLSNKRHGFEETWYHDQCAQLGLPCPTIESPNERLGSYLLITKYLLLIIPAWAPLVWVVHGKALRGWGIPTTDSIITDSDTTSQESFKTNSLEKSTSSSKQSSRTERTLIVR